MQIASTWEGIAAARVLEKEGIAYVSTSEYAGLTVQL
jgi:transaldolase